MWKYECKRHLLYLLISAAAGAVLFGITIDDSFIKEITSLYDWMPIEAARQAYELRWAVGGLVGAALVNGLLLARYLISYFNISPMVVLLVILLASSVFQFLMIAGLLLLIPTVLVCLYGMLTVRSSAAKNFRSLPSGDGNEVERIYRLHHPFKEDVASLATKCRKESDRWTLIYFLGLIALMCLLLIIPSFALMMLIVMGYALLSVYVFRLRAQSVVPINSLLFDQCDPLACASAILCFSRRGKRRMPCCRSGTFTKSAASSACAPDLEQMWPPWLITPFIPYSTGDRKAPASLSMTTVFFAPARTWAWSTKCFRWNG